MYILLRDLYSRLARDCRDNKYLADIRSIGQSPLKEGGGGGRVQNLIIFRRAVICISTIDFLSLLLNSWKFAQLSYETVIVRLLEVFFFICEIIL